MFGKLPRFDFFPPSFWILEHTRALPTAKLPIAHFFSSIVSLYFPKPQRGPRAGHREVVASKAAAYPLTRLVVGLLGLQEYAVGAPPRPCGARVSGSVSGLRPLRAPAPPAGCVGVTGIRGIKALGVGQSCR